MASSILGGLFGSSFFILSINFLCFARGSKAFNSAVNLITSGSFSTSASNFTGSAASSAGVYPTKSLFKSFANFVLALFMSDFF